MKKIPIVLWRLTKHRILFPIPPLKKTYFAKLELTQKIVMLTAITMMFIFSFLIGDNIRLPLFQKNYIAIYYIFSYFKDVQSFLESNLVDTQTYIPYYIHVAFMVFFLAANIIVCTVCLIAAIIKFAFGLFKKEIRLFRVLLPALISTFGAIVILSINFNIYYIKPAFNGATVVELVLISVLLTGILITEFFLRPQNYMKNIYGFLGFSVAGIMLFLAVITMLPAYLTIKGAGSQNISVLFDCMIYSSSYKINSAQNLFFYGLAATLIFLLFVSFSIKSIASVAKSVNRGQSPCKAAITFYVFTAVFAVAELVFACLITAEYNKLLSTGNVVSIGASPILSVLFVVIGFSAMITGKCLQMKQQKKKS